MTPEETNKELEFKLLGLEEEKEDQEAEARKKAKEAESENNEPPPKTKPSINTYFNRVSKFKKDSIMETQKEVKLREEQKAQRIAQFQEKKEHLWEVTEALTKYLDYENHKSEPKDPNRDKVEYSILYPIIQELRKDWAFPVTMEFPGKKPTKENLKKAISFFKELRKLAREEAENLESFPEIGKNNFTTRTFIRNHGRKEDRQLTLPLFKEIEKIGEREMKLYDSGGYEKLQLYISQKIGKLKTPEGKENLSSLVQFTENPILTKAEIKNICGVGDTKAKEMLNAWTCFSYHSSAMLPHKGGLVALRFIDKVEYSSKKEVSPYISLKALEYIQENGFGETFPDLTLPKMKLLNGFSFVLLKRLHDIQRDKEVRLDVNKADAFWIKINVQTLYERFLEKPWKTQNGHDIRIKNEFVEALEELQKKGFFKKPPRFVLAYLNKNGNLCKDPKILNKGEVEKFEKPLKRGEIQSVYSLESIKKSEWAYIAKKMALCFCLSFDSTEERTRQRIRLGIQGKRLALEEKRKKRKAEKQKAPEARNAPETKAPEDLEDLNLEDVK